jgi:hypothetical protein
MLGPLIQRIDRACRSALGGVGFEWRYGKRVLDVNEDVVARVGLGRSVYRAQQIVGIAPVVSVAHIPLELEVLRLKGRAPVKRFRVPATVATPVGYLMPQNSFTEWKFSEGDDVAEIARDIAANVVTYGRPFIDQHRTLEDFYESMITRRYGGSFPRFVHSLAVAALMLGRPDTAREHVEKYLETLGDRNDCGAQDDREFAARFLENLESGNPTLKGGEPGR